MKLKVYLLIVLMAAVVGCQDVEFELTESKIESLQVGEVALVIESDHPYVNKQDVQLTIYAKNADEMYVTADGSCESGGEWEPYSEGKRWNLEKRNQGVVVYAKFRNSGGFESSCINDDIIHDDIAPEVDFTAVPTKLSNNNKVNLLYSVKEELSGVKSTICWDNDLQKRILCSEAGATFQLDADGEKNFWVQVVDKAGNHSNSISYRWVFDQTPPDLVLLEKPSSINNSESARFTIESEDKNGVEQIECLVVGKSNFGSCDRVQSYNGLSEGRQTFQYRAKDRAGNMTAVMSYKWLIDRTPPEVKFLKTPLKQTKLVESNFKYVGSDNLTAWYYRCQRDGEEYKACKEEDKFSVYGDGSHSFRVKAVDQAGNESSEIAYSWLLDTEAPDLVVDSTPQGTTNKERGLLNWKISDIGSGVKSIRCQQAGSLVSCGAEFKKWYENQKIGHHNFTIYVEDLVGNSKSYDLNWQIYQAVKKVVMPLNIDHRGPVDVLFVIDNSQSMSLEQDEMGRRFDNFLNYIDDLDWQVGITTTDPREDKEYGEGRLVEFEGAGGARVLDSSFRSDVAHRLFKKTIKRDEWGSSVEQGIAATYRSIERMSFDAVHRQFYRKDSHLSVVLVSDENETGDKVRNQPKELIKLVEKKWSKKKTFRFHSIITRPGDGDCASFEHTEGEAYAELTKLTGGILGDICSDSYASQLANIGEDIRNLLKRITLKCLPMDEDGDGQPDILVDFDKKSNEIPYHLEGNELVFSEPAPIGHHKVYYQCIDKD